MRIEQPIETTEREIELLGRIRPDATAQILGTGYMDFASPIGISGLAKWQGNRLDLLLVIADEPGTGQFREFIWQAKEKYKTVCVWEDWNPQVGKALARYGFSPETEIQGDGEIINGWRWDKPQ